MRKSPFSMRSKPFRHPKRLDLGEFRSFSEPQLSAQSCQLSEGPWPVMSKVVIVGGGLAGLSAACELLERGCKVTILVRT